MKMQGLKIRQARVEDAQRIAEVVAMAIGDELALRDYCGDSYLSVLEDVARQKGTQYSYEQALVADVDGEVAGVVVGYDGAKLDELRSFTRQIIQDRVGAVPFIEDETECGEFYIDSLGVYHAYRGRGIGKQLLAAMCDKAASEGHSCAGLLVDVDNPNAEKIYLSEGFSNVGPKMFFGHDMKHLQKKIGDF